MITVNAMGDICPIPVVKTKKALGELNGSGQIEVLVDNETAVRNVMKMAKSSGAAAEQVLLEPGWLENRSVSSLFSLAIRLAVSSVCLST